MNETRSMKETVPYAFLVALAFFIAGFVTYAFFHGAVFDGVMAQVSVSTPSYVHDWTIIGGWVAAWTVVGFLIGFYYGRK